MIKLAIQWALTSSFCVFALVGQAQTNYDKVEAGTVLTGGIGMGTFVKPMPLPPGEWVVLSKSDGSTAVGGSPLYSPGSTPTVSIVARNGASNSPLVALIVEFLPNSLPLKYSNNDCKQGTAVFHDPLDTRTSDVLYACAVGDVSGQFQRFVSDAPNSNNPWIKNNFSAFAPFSKSLPDTIFYVRISGNKDIGREVQYFFVAKLEGNPQSDAAYLKHITDWTHLAGLEIKKYLENQTANIPPLASYPGK